MKRIFEICLAFMLASLISPSVFARYLINWDDFSKTREVCGNVCVQEEWQEMKFCEVVCDGIRSRGGIERNPQLSAPIPAQAPYELV